MRQTDAFRSGSSFLNSKFSVRSGAAALIRSIKNEKRYKTTQCVPDIASFVDASSGQDYAAITRHKQLSL